MAEAQVAVPKGPGTAVEAWSVEILVAVCG